MTETQSANNEDSLSRELQRHEPGKRRWQWIWRALLVTGAAYLVFFTLLWQFICLLLLEGVVMVLQIGVPAEEKPHLLDYTRTQPVLRAICDGGNWVADRSQPLVSDEVLIAHWKKYRQHWEEALKQMPRSPNATSEDYRAFEKRLNLIGLYGMSDGDPGDPEHFVSVTPLQTIGAHQSMRICVGRSGSSKGYTYYPATAPVVHDGRVMRPSEVETYRPERLGGMSGNKLVDSTDRVLYEAYSKRMLSPHWYIKRAD